MSPKKPYKKLRYITPTLPDFIITTSIVIISIIGLIFVTKPHHTDNTEQNSTINNFSEEKYSTPVASNDIYQSADTQTVTSTLIDTSNSQIIPLYNSIATFVQMNNTVTMGITGYTDEFSTENSVFLYAAFKGNLLESGYTFTNEESDDNTCGFFLIISGDKTFTKNSISNPEIFRNCKFTIDSINNSSEAAFSINAEYKYNDKVYLFKGDSSACKKTVIGNG